MEETLTYRFSPHRRFDFFPSVCVHVLCNIPKVIGLLDYSCFEFEFPAFPDLWYRRWFLKTIWIKLKNTQDPNYHSMKAFSLRDQYQQKVKSPLVDQKVSLNANIVNKICFKWNSFLKARSERGDFYFCWQCWRVLFFSFIQNAFGHTLQ